MTPEDLLKIMPFAGARAAIYAEPLTAAMVEFGIDSPARQSCFLAQLAHESASLAYVKEIADGSAYEGRADLGNLEPGDGKRFPGRGFGQVTGRANYLACGAALGYDLISNPALLEQPIPACRSAGWFWKTKGMSTLADQHKFGTITKLWNGGYNGLDDRLQHWLRARKVLGL